ncbi:MAG: head-tail adaptor protein [Pseudomonadota bacterium]
MVASFRKDEKVTIERLAGTRDPVYNTEIEAWVVVADRIWANVQDALPGNAEATSNGLRTSLQQTRLRIRSNTEITPKMRVTLHGRGDRVMEIVAGPALLDDRQHAQFMLESYSP